MVNRVKSERCAPRHPTLGARPPAAAARERRLRWRPAAARRDGLEDYVAALTGRPFVPLAVPVLPLAPPQAYMLPELLGAARALPPHAPGFLPPGVSRGFGALCASRAVLQLPRVVVSHAHAAERWASWLPGLGPVRPRPASGGEGAAAALEHAVRAAVTAAMGYSPAAMVGYPYIMGSHIEDNAKFMTELRVIVESEGVLTCMPRRLFRRRHAFGHEILVSCAGSIFVQDPESGEFMGLVANRIVATLR